MADSPTLKDSLIAASSSADYQRKMAKVCEFLKYF
jgi:hypothetical protein